MAEFGAATAILNQWVGTKVRLQMMNGEVPGTVGAPGARATLSGVSLVVEGELVQVYDNAITVKTSDDVQWLMFAQAIRAIRQI